MKFKTSDGLELYYELSGKGIPCVFLHGGPGYWSKSFRHFSEDYLAEKLKMVYLDQRGCGRSEHCPMQNYSLDRLIDDMEELKIHLGFNEWLLMGHSFGGILAVNYAYRFPERTTGIILSNVTLHMFHSLRQQMRKGSDLLEIEISVSAFMTSYHTILSQLIDKEMYFDFQYIDVEKKKNVDVIDQEGLNSDPNFQRYVFSSEEYFQDFTLLTSKIFKPVLIITGEYDYAVGPNHHHFFQFKYSKVRELKGSHHPYIENQTEFKHMFLIL